MVVRTIKNNSEKKERADVLLANKLPEYSRAALAKLFDKNAVIANKKPIKAGCKIKPGDKFSADISDLQMQAEKINLPIIYEDKNVIIIDKPVGVISHARGKFWDESSVASFVRDKVSGMDGERAGIVHRLDRATSGVMVCAKNPETLGFLQKQFSRRKTKKAYYAIVNGIPDPKEALIDVPIARNPKKLSTFKADANGKPATTLYSVKKTSNNLSLLELKPATGRTHQLRVHLNYIGHPIIGDTIYGGKSADRLFLHAYSIEITLPGGERKTFISDLPKNFNELIK